MRIFTFLAAATAVGGLAAPLAAQSPYPYPYPQTYQQVPQPYPGQPGYGYNQGYGNQSSVGAIINQLLGNRYNVSDRTAVSQCANAAINQAVSQYRPRAYGAYGGQYGYQQGYSPAAMMRVTAITEVQRRNSGLRVTGLLDSGAAVPPYGQAYGYQNRGYAATGDLRFRCNVDYRGYVTNLRISRHNGYRG